MAAYMRRWLLSGVGLAIAGAVFIYYHLQKVEFPEDCQGAFAANCPTMWDHLRSLIGADRAGLDSNDIRDVN